MSLKNYIVIFSYIFQFQPHTNRYLFNIDRFHIMDNYFIGANEYVFKPFLEQASNKIFTSIFFQIWYKK